MLREKIYELKNWKLAVHTTWNPGAENVMRIHLVPPRFLSGKIVPSVVILNGQEIVPVSEAPTGLSGSISQRVRTLVK